LEDSDLVILPGVGNFGGVMQALHDRELYQPTLQYLNRGLPFIGICVGMQVLFESSSEMPGARGFSHFKGALEDLSALDSSQVTPSIGWQPLIYKPNHHVAPVLREAYFVHNYFASDVDESQLISTYDWNGHRIPAHIAEGRIHGVQFHPEKSRHEGLKFLKSLIEDLAK
jgi:imidazole glycerol phosphate synthase glutamine amidotransferase subunit